MTFYRNKFKRQVSLIWCKWSVRNILTSSTLMFSLALVSNNWIPICWANVCASSVTTTFRSGSSFLLPTARQENISQFTIIGRDAAQKENFFAINYYSKPHHSYGGGLVKISSQTSTVMVVDWPRFHHKHKNRRGWGLVKISSQT